MKMRTESDFLGSIQLDDDALYGINTARAIDNFGISKRNVHIDSLKILYEAVSLFTSKCVKTLSANVEACRYHLDKSRAYAMKYVTEIGYEAVERLISESGGDKEKFIILAEQEKERKNG